MSGRHVDHAHEHDGRAHRHGHDHHVHEHDVHGNHGHPSSRPFVVALILAVGYGIIEALGGWWTGSLALLSDAGHMFSDGLALAVAAVAAWLARRPPGGRHSYGWARAEVLGGLINGIMMLLLVALIYLEAAHRLMNPLPVRGEGVLGIALIGLIVNIIMAWQLHGGEPNLNREAALLHVIGDLVSSVAALVAGALVYFTGWTPIDPLISALIATIILVSTVRLIRNAFHVLMEGVPLSLDMNDIGVALARSEGIVSVHDLHVWSIGTGRPMISAHVEIADMSAWPRILRDARTLLRDRYDLDHVTLQPEPVGTLPLQATVRLWPRRPRSG